MDEAVHFGHHDVVTILRDYHTKYSPQDPATDKQNVEKNLDGMLWWTGWRDGKRSDGHVTEVEEDALSREGFGMWHRLQQRAAEGPSRVKSSSLSY